jgi:UDP-glucose 4-epimerase
MAAPRRILITGLSSQLGGRLAQLLEHEAWPETVIGVGTEDPRHELQHTEFVRLGTDETLLRRILRAARIDTVVVARAVPDAGLPSLLSAAAGPGSPVRKLVFASSARIYGCSGRDPAFFTEEMPPTRRPQGTVERKAVASEAELDRFEYENPAVMVTRLRVASAIGPGRDGDHLALLGLPVIPGIAGFDPRWQFVHEDDVVGALLHAVSRELPGAYNVAADGVLALSEVAALLGKPLLPVLPPWGTAFAGHQLRRLGLGVPVELLRELRYGRGLDNRRLKATGYRFRHTSREAMLKLRAQQRLRPLLGSGGSERFRYEREVEDFLRWSPSVRVAGRPRRLPGQAGALGDLTDGELLEIIDSLDTESMRHLREHEAGGERRAAVLAALDQQLALRGSPARE